MSKKRKTTKGNPAVGKWTPFAKVQPTPNLKARETDPEGYDELWKLYESGLALMFQNNLYTVHLRYLNAERKIDGATWLSIRTYDRKPTRDWRHLQRIKNELVGREREAVEIYPKESDLVDEANTYHLWVLDCNDSLPFGFKGERRVGDSKTAEAVGAGQRDFDE